MLSNQQKLSTFQNTKISLIDLQRNPLKQWTDKMIHTWWMNEPIQWHVISVRLMKSAIKNWTSQMPKKWQYFYRCNFFFVYVWLLLLKVEVVVEACRRMIRVVRYCFFFLFCLLDLFHEFELNSFSSSLQDVFGIPSSSSGWIGICFYKHNIDINTWLLFIYFWYFRFGIHYCL